MTIKQDKCDACGQEVGLTGIWKVQLVHKYFKIKASLPKSRAKTPTKFHPQIGKIEGLLTALSKEMGDFESYQKQSWGLMDKLIQEKGGTEKNTLDLNFCESCWKEWALQADELGQTLKNFKE